MLMKSRKHSISGLQNDSTFNIFFFGFGCNGLDCFWHISLFSIFTSLYTLNWRLAPEKLGLCQVMCISPCLKRDMTVQSSKLNSASLAKKKKKEKQFSRLENILWCMAHCSLWGLGCFSLFLPERTKLSSLKSLVLLTHFEDLLNDMDISVHSELK